MEQLPIIAKLEIFDVPFKLSTEIEEVDINWIETNTMCYFYSPNQKVKNKKSKKKLLNGIAKSLLVLLTR